MQHYIPRNPKAYIYIALPYITPSGVPISWVHCQSHTEEAGSLFQQFTGDHHNKKTCVSSPEVEARSEHSSTRGNENTPELVPEAGPSFEQQGQEPARPPLVH